MDTANPRERRKLAEVDGVDVGAKAGLHGHPGGAIKHNVWTQILRLVLLIMYFFSSITSIVTTQFMGLPLYFVSKRFYYRYMALTKQSFGIFVTTMTHWWAPTLIRISGDASIMGQLHQNADGGVEFRFPERMVMIANHQIYSDWLYLWWTAYANSPRMHGHIYIILKESLKHIPIIGWGMQFYSFIFLSRKWETDKPRLAYRLGKLKEHNLTPLSGSKILDPMWLLIFPEGTNASSNTKKKSTQWAQKQGIKDMEHVLLPRSTGSFFCLNELKGTLDYVYDCTIAYEGVPRGKFGQDLFTLRSMYLQGRPPPSVNMYWRRLAIADMPLDDPHEFDLWLTARWYEKDALMEHFLTTGRFPATQAATNGEAKDFPEETSFIDTEVKLTHWWEVGNIFVVLAVAALLINLVARVWNAVFYGKQ